MRHSITAILTGIMAAGAFAATPARAQQGDTVPQAVDSARRADSTRKADSARAEPAAPAKADLRALGAVEGGISLAADLSAKTLTVVGSNGAIKTFNVAVGTPSYPTPTGTFRIRKIVWNPSWIPPDSKWAKNKKAKGPGEPGNPMKVAKIFFKEPDYYIHGTGQVNSLGTADSHGCLRMSPDEVAELAQFLMNNGGQPREEGWFSRIIHMRWKTHTVYLSQPITLVVAR